jgi:hypothetical protein
LKRKLEEISFDVAKNRYKQQQTNQEISFFVG